MGIITTSYKTNYIDLLLQDISFGSTNNYFLFVGNIQPWDDESNPPAVFSSIDDSIFNTQINMILGKKLSSNNIRYMFKRYNWSSNTVYTQYDHNSINLNESVYYIITDENKVYKCISNGNDNPSVIKPTLIQNTSFKTSDDYVWKYMFSIEDSDMKHFATRYHVPININTSIVDSSTTGIEHIQLLTGGSGYIATVNGSVQTVVAPDCIQIDNYGSNVDDFYTNSAFYVYNGPDSGSLRTITRYVSNTIGNYCFLDTPLNGVTPILSKYKITPSIKILGDGTGAQAICDVNAQNSIANLTIISTGNGYTRATALVNANTLWGSGASVYPIVSPRGGHGSNPVDELNASALGVYVSFANTSFNQYANTTFHRFGLMKNPKSSANSSQLISNDFISVLKVSTSPSIVFTVGDQLIGNTSGASAIVVQSNSTVTTLSGDKSFIINETVQSMSSATSTTISNIISRGDIDDKSSEILYINNTTKLINQSNNPTFFKIVFDIFDNNAT